MADSINYIALSRQMALHRQLDVVANNIANASTPGFKVESIMMKEFPVYLPNGNKISFVQDMGLATDFTQGGMTRTGAPLDIAINGEGYFAVAGPNGNRYTRSGHFKLDANGQIITPNGDALLSSSNTPLLVPTDAQQITITRDGTVSTEQGKVGKVGVVTFDNPQVLERESGALFVLPPKLADANAPKQSKNAEMTQGMLEESNVKSVVEMTKMMELSRAYEASQKLLDREDERVRQTIRRLGQLNQ
ncbi:MAG: flagellar basal-body rod protein FlgF [Dongiaceae bacterium]